MRSVLCVLSACLLVAAAGCGGSTEQSAPEARGPFAYDDAPLRFADRGRVNARYPIAIRDVSYTAGRDRIAAYLVLPPKSGARVPAVIYLHGSGGDRTQFVVPATWLAARHADRAGDHCSVGHGAGSGEQLARRQAPSAGPARGARRGRRPAGDRPASPAAGRRPEPDRLRGLERGCPLRGDPRGRRATAAHPGPDVGRIHAGLGLCRTSAGFVALDGSPLPDDRRPAPLRRTRNRVRAAPAGRAARPGGAAVSARSHGHRGAQRDDPALVRRGSRAEREGLPRPDRMARAEAPACSARP